MFEIQERPRMVERAVLVGVYHRKEEEADAANLLEELGSLVDTLGVPILERVLARVPRPHPKLLTGTGKADEIIARAKSLEADVLIFDNELTPGQQRNWEQLSGLTVIDRQEVILDIFGRRAQTREARLQVELARLEYNLPRLTRGWTHLSRQGGGIGGRGEGETQLETDRRLVRKQIDKLKAEIAEVRSSRATQRKQRERLPLPNAAIVGYTNAGKSSLLKRLTGADVLVEDKLFATLDTTTRRVELPSGQPLLLTDTVGFVRRLPHQLVDSFRATLEEATLADFLVHVVDASHPQAIEFHNTTRDVLGELGAGDKPTVTVFNKIDLPAGAGQAEVLRLHFPGAVFLSTRTGDGIPALLDALAAQLASRIAERRLVLPTDRADLLALLHREGKVLSEKWEADHIEATVLIPPKFDALFAPFRQGTPHD
jgi:GTP-binding protein HflX